MRALYLLLALLLVPASIFSSEPTPSIPLLLRKLESTARVLYITAHPDDEDAALVARLNFVDGADVALMTLTRGEGGQNEIGDELFGALGVLRSRELQAAHRFDGCIQYHSHALDFGYSFSVEETYERWGRNRALKDIVAVIREFRPDVILTMKPDGGGGGQHHQASARLAQDAFKLAAEEDRWPELGSPHTVRRLFRQVRADEVDVENLCEMEVGQTDSLLGKSPLELGARSRGEHKCQGMVFQHQPFERRSSRWEWLLASDGQTRGGRPHILDGIGEPFAEDSDRSKAWKARVESIRASFRSDEPAGVLPRLVELWQVVAQEGSTSEEALRAPLAEMIRLALGLRFSARTRQAFAVSARDVGVEFVVANEGPLDLSLQVAIGSRAALEHTTEVEGLPVAAGERTSVNLVLRSGPEVYSLPRSVPGDSISEDRDAFLWNNWRSYWCDIVVDLGRTSVPLANVPVECEWVDPRFPQLRYGDLHMVPDPSIRFSSPVSVAPHASDATPSVDVEALVSTLLPRTVEVEFEVSDGWTVATREQTIESPGYGVEVPVVVRLEASKPGASRATIAARARHGESGGWVDVGYRRIEYPHIRSDALLVQGRAAVIAFPCDVDRERVVGYVEGTGDRVLAAIDRLGMRTRLLTTAELESADLGGVDVIISGVRAFKVRDDLKSAWPRIHDWIESGGTFICQYNKFEFNDGGNESPWVPFEGARVSRNRVTDETAPVTIRQPDHSVFHAPNELGPEDWQGWVQERGLYFLEVDGKEYVDLVSIEEPFPFNAGVKEGALVHARVGEGDWVYVGLGLFRQLPAGVPGAYRLLANLLAL